MLSEYHGVSLKERIACHLKEGGFRHSGSNLQLDE